MTRDPALRDGPLFDDPFAWFGDWFDHAHQTDLVNPNACLFATVSATGQPAARVVLLKEWDERGFVIYTNLTSRKGREACEQGRAAITFWWRELGRQIRIEGPVEQVPDARADAYFATRPRGSQLGAWASQQSMPLESRDALMARVEHVEREYEGRDVPRPPHWSGLELVPERIEFWSEGEFRLHDRFLFERPSPDEGWTITRLNP